MELDLKYRALLGKAGFMACNYGLADEAKQIFDALHSTAPDRVGPMIGQAMACAAAGDFTAAVKRLKDEVLKDNPDDNDAKAYLGLVYHLDGKNDEAKKVLQPLAENGNAFAEAIMQEIG
jgi:cytochrome c-type biogenesis protein CcmH/NrfG